MLSPKGGEHIYPPCRCPACPCGLAAERVCGSRGNSGGRTGYLLLSIYLSMYLSIYLYIHLSTYLPTSVFQHTNLKFSIFNLYFFISTSYISLLQYRKVQYWSYIGGGACIWWHIGTPYKAPVIRLSVLANLFPSKGRGGGGRCNP